MEVYLTKLEKNLSRERLAHSLRVAALAKELALKAGLSPKKTYLAGLLHDCAHDLPPSVLLQKSEEFGILVGKIERKLPFLLHGPVGAELAKRDYGIEDPLILEAIDLHTTGKPEMSKLSRVVCLADYIEPERNFEGLKKIREVAATDLDQALLLAFDNTLRYLLIRGELIHPQTIFTRNWLLEMKKEDSG